MDEIAYGIEQLIMRRRCCWFCLLAFGVRWTLEVGGHAGRCGYSP
jgi:hypothetical protein